MTVKRKITSRHGVDSRPLSEWLRDAWRATRECGASLCAASPERNSRRMRRDVYVPILRLLQPARPTLCWRRLGLSCRSSWAGRPGARPHFVSTTTLSASGGVYWIPKLGEELAKADMVLCCREASCPSAKWRCLSLSYSVRHSVGDVAHDKSTVGAASWSRTAAR
jgi:hypothetical protein